MHSWFQGTDSRAADRAAAAVAPASIGNPRTLFRQQEYQGASVLTDGGSRQQNGGFGAAASDPMTFQPAYDRDDVPNMGDEQPWRISAMHAHAQTNAQQRRTSPTPSQTTLGRKGSNPANDKKPGAVVKLGRRQAWLKYLAYEVGKNATSIPTTRISYRNVLQFCSADLFFQIKIPAL